MPNPDINANDAYTLLIRYYNLLMDEFNGQASEEAIDIFIEREYGQNEEEL